MTQEASDVDLQPWPTNEDGSLQMIPCDNCGSSAIAMLKTPNGCVALPGKQDLNVCAQHLNNWGFLSGDAPVLLLSELEPGIARWAGW
jgi:hypothetical protein